MTIKELVKLLKEYPDDMKVEINVKKDFDSEVRELQIQDLADRYYDGEQSLLISPTYLYPYQ